MSSPNPFARLALEVKRGVPSAARRFRQAMKPEVEFMIWRTLRHEIKDDPWEARIRTEVDYVVARSNPRLAPDAEGVVDAVAQRLCDALIDGLQREGSLHDRCGVLSARETIVC